MSKFQLTQIDTLIFNLISKNSKFRFEHDEPSLFRFIQTEPDDWRNIKYLFDFLWVGGVSGNYLYSVTDDRKATIIGKDFSENYIPNTSIATFTMPLDTDFIADDTDNLWFVGGIQRAVTEDELENWDYSRTIIKYDNDTPHHIRWIGLLSSSIILNATEINQLHDYFELSIFWNDVLNAYGRIKANRPIDDHPIPLSAEIPSGQPTKVVITFNQDLFAGSIPDVSAFTLAGKVINLVEVLADKVTLTVTVGYDDDTVTVDYTQSVNNPLRSALGGGKVEDFAGQSVTNNIYGPEMMYDPGFDNPLLWFVNGSGVSIGGSVGIFNSAASAQNLQPFCYGIRVTGATYKVVFTIVSYSAGAIRVNLGQTLGTQFNTTGIKTQLLVCGADINTFYIRAAGTTTATIDNLSLKKLL